MANRAGILAGSDGPALFCTEAAGLPALAGAYILLLQLTVGVAVRLPGRPEARLAPGRYLYCGSARGHGGIRARVGRHMRADKPTCWHIDQLTNAGTVVGAWAFPDGRECALMEALSALPVPIPGFGSSDCRLCPSHLLAWPQGINLPFE